MNSEIQLYREVLINLKKHLNQQRKLQTQEEMKSPFQGEQ
jgi:hypothetical protein